MKLASVMILASALSFQMAFANGVEKTLPRDAKNVKIESAVLGNNATGQKLINDGIEGPQYENTYSDAIEVVVTYQSKDDSDAPKSGSGLDGQFMSGDSTSPTLYFFLPLSKEEVASIKAKKVDPRDLVAYNVEVKTVQVAVQTEYKCRYDNDTNLPEFGCVEPAPKLVSEQHPVLTIGRK